MGNIAEVFFFFNSSDMDYGFEEDRIWQVMTRLEQKIFHLKISFRGAIIQNPSCSTVAFHLALRTWEGELPFLTFTISDEEGPLLVPIC